LAITADLSGQSIALRLQLTFCDVLGSQIAQLLLKITYFTVAILVVSHKLVKLYFFLRNFCAALQTLSLTFAPIYLAIVGNVNLRIGAIGEKFLVADVIKLRDLIRHLFVSVTF
jgi:hypothetical protein